ncbi:hypothetical protein THMIRHAT_19540 [Thiosulfativibrio zosterae]|uniref:Uncharacterized protein n=1 Tax=Thiosulfativibrio zosterae TaxID=2675053 RepID=A0A6F8PQA0_9GAMM|nr:hypothetical protein THMIRHAT_19540 [Thiosulfativibrio zosterae]
MLQKDKEQFERTPENTSIPVILYLAGKVSLHGLERGVNDGIQQLVDNQRGQKTDNQPD